MQGKSQVSSDGRKNVISSKELAVLKCLKERAEESKDRTLANISEISTKCGIRDSDEVVRALYTLEGKSLVQPEPIGDFTSTFWKITPIGQRALEVL
jgi:DNA-binding MarR family transcriptional regulator